MSYRSFYFYGQELRKLLSSDLHLFEVSVWIQSFAQALIAVFIPIILWKLGLTIRDILLFYFIFNAVDVPLNFLARHLIQKVGARLVLIFAITANLLYFLTLYSLSSVNWTALFLLAFFFAVYDSFYWVAHLYIFVGAAHSSDKIRTDVSTLNIVRVVGGILAPAVGAALLIYSNPHTLIYVTTLLMFASLVPLFQMRHLVFKPEHRAMSFREFFSRPHEKADYGVQALAGLQSEVEDVLYPFFIFLVFGSIADVAWVPILISLGSLVITYVVAKYSIKQNIYKIISIGALLTGVMWIIRLYLLGALWLVFVSVFVIELVATLVQLPADVATFERGKQTDVLSAATYRNVVHMGGRALLYGVLLVFVPVVLGTPPGHYMGYVFWVAFILVTISAFVLFAFAQGVSFGSDRRFKLLPEPIEEDA